MTLEQEAKDFMIKQEKTVKPIDRTVVRYYTGCALTALLQNSGASRSEYHDEIVNNAFAWGIKMAEKERSRT